MSIFSIIISIFVFSLFVLVHELGHFWTARWFKVKVNEFSIGMGPSIWKYQSKKGDKTLYSIRAIPLGGFCKMEGEDFREELEQNSEHIEKRNLETVNLGSKKFNQVSRWKRIIILASGAIMNIVLGYILMVSVLMMSGNIITTQIERVVENSPMSQAQVVAGDRLLSINNHHINTGSDAFYYLGNALATSADKTVEFKIQTQNQTLTKKITAVYDQSSSRYVFGIVYKKIPSNLGNSIVHGFFDSVLIVKSVIDMLGRILTFQFNTIRLSGPIGIISEISKVAQEKNIWVGLIGLFYLSAQITINLGALNLVPIPALDGGRILFLLVEMVRGEPISPKKEAYVHLAGFILLILLIVLVSVVDIRRLRT